MKLNDGQMAAATMILTTSDRIVAVQGVSGAGKSTMLSAVARIAEQEGRKVIGLAIMKVTADRLGQETGIESRTVSSFINSYSRPALAGQGAGYEAARAQLAGTVLFLDEASMIGNDQMKHLTGIVNSLGGQLAEIGDRKQIAAVDAGKAFSVMQEGGVTMARMDENLRQRTEQLRTVAALSNRGAVREAMAVLGDKVIANPEVAKAASQYWLKLSPEQREITAMFSSGRVARAEINIRIQEGLAAEGTIKGEGVAVGVLDKVNIAREQLRYAQFYEKGQVLDLHRAVRELRLPAGTFDVLGVDAKGRVQVQIGSKVHTFDPQRLSPLDQTDPIQLAKREEIKLHEGDKIRWTKNDKERGLNNNEIAKVLSADKDGIKVEGLDGKIHELKTGDPMMERISLAYALNMHAAQGITTDTAHVLVEPTTTRENFYVAMTRGRESNHAYVVLDRPDDHAAPHPSDNEEATGRSVLYGVLQHSGAELSAHETITAEQDQWGSIAQLAAEYETIAAAAQHDRWAALIRCSGLSDEQAESAIESEAFGPLAAELRRAEANHHNLDALLPRLVAARGFDDADDIAAVLHYRVERATGRPAGSGRTRKPTRLIAGLIPQAHGVIDVEMRAALDEREELIAARADAVLDGALAESVPWTKALGTPPTEPRRAAAWRKSARVIAAYRDRYRVTDDTPLGAPPESAVQKIDAARARAALDRVRVAAETVDDAHAARSPSRGGPSRAM